MPIIFHIPICSDFKAFEALSYKALTSTVGLLSGKTIIIFDAIVSNEKSDKNLSPNFFDMKQYTNSLYEEYIQNLGSVPVKNLNEMEIAAGKLELSKSYLDKLKEFICSYSFKNPKEEIFFFKRIKPDFYSKFLYYSELVYVLSHIPAGDKEAKIAFLKKMIDEHNKFIDRNRQLFNYYKLNHSHDDTRYFLRDAICPPPSNEYYGELDNSFCTVHSSFLSKLIAYEELNTYLSDAIEKLKYGKNTSNNNYVLEEPPAENAKEVKFIGKKSELQELILAQYANGDFGDTPLNWVMEAYEKALSTNLGNYYAAEMDMAMRKKSRTPYLKKLADALEKRLDKKLENI